MTKSARVSFVILGLAIILSGVLHLEGLLLSALFSFFLLTRLAFIRTKWLTVVFFFVVLFGLAYAAGHFIREAVVELPRIADKSIPPIVTWAQGHGVELPFTDYDSLKHTVRETAKEEAQYLHNFATFAEGATRVFVALIIGTIVAAGIFLDPRMETSPVPDCPEDNFYSSCCREIALRFRRLYDCFATVMGAQLVISIINTILTGIFVFSIGLPNATLMTAVTFFCGILPVVGNLISGTIIVCLAFTLSPNMALVSFIFLLVIHKLEYFLNSKIIGHRIGNPIWLTLLGLIIGERLMGIPGMILAPVVLNYIRIETSKVRAKAAEQALF